MSVVDSDVYPDQEEDTFIREPFVVKFSSDVISGLDHFVIIAIHTQPKVDNAGDGLSVWSILLSGSLQGDRQSG